MVRLFVGGLPAGCTPEDLRQRFQPFGEVAEVAIAPPKVYGRDAVFPRNFAHVELTPKDEASLRKCISAYNGCQYKGSVLRVAQAHQHHTQRMRQEDEMPVDSAADADAEPAPALPPLGPGTLLRLKEPKAPSLVEVTLDSGRKLDAFSEPPSPAGGAPRPSWGPLDVPPASGYLYEQLLQRIADDLPPELLALVEARRLLGQEMRERRERQREEEAGVEVAYDYAPEGSQDSASLQLSSDDDAATSAAAAAAAISARSRKRAVAGGSALPGAMASPAAAHDIWQQLPQQKAQRQRRAAAAPAQLKVVDFIHGGEAEAEGDQAQIGTAVASTAAADMSRFDSDSDGEWIAPPSAAAARPARPPKQQQQQQQQKSQKQRQQAQKQARGRLVAVGQAEAELLPASSGSSGGSELEDWLAGGGEASGGSAASDPAAGDSPDGSSGHGGALVSSGSSGGSELEEWLAAVEGDATSPRTAAAASDQEQQEEQGQQQRGEVELTSRGPGSKPATPSSPVQQQAEAQQVAVVDFLDGGEMAVASGQQRWRRPGLAAAPADLDRFASSSSEGEEEQGGIAAATGQRPAARQQRQQRQQLLGSNKRRRSERGIPQVDGAADSDSDSDSASSGDSSSSEGDTASGEESGGESGEEATSSGSSSDEDGSGSEGEEQQGKAAERQGRALATSSPAAAESSGSDSEGDGGTASADGSAAAAAAAAQEQQRQLAALFPEGASFVRSEPLAQIDATWRVSRESWVQDYRQKHRQAVRLLGRSTGGAGAGKRQRKT